MASLVSLKDTTTANNIYKAVTATLSRFSLHLGKISWITTDGAPAMVGKREGLVKLIENEALLSGNTKMMKYHCIIHQGNLCSKSLKIESVMKVLVKTVNFIRSRQFQEVSVSRTGSFKNYLMIWIHNLVTLFTILKLDG